jgi:hypothetical protein
MCSQLLFVKQMPSKNISLETVHLGRGGGGDFLIKHSFQRELTIAGLCLLEKLLFLRREVIQMYGGLPWLSLILQHRQIALILV